MNIQNEFVHKTKEYAIGRPSYPIEVLNIINKLGIKKQSIIADIGAGTGLLTNRLGNLDCTILAIEPNEDMLKECMNYCSNRKNIKFVHATAEATFLQEKSVDIITIAQAFHWFDKPLYKVEFKRF